MNQYISKDDFEKNFRSLSDEEGKQFDEIAKEASALIDSYAPNADEERKIIVCMRVVRRALSNMQSDMIPMGATGGTYSALGYSQSFQLSGGTIGEIYLGKTEKKMLGVSDKIGMSSVLENMAGSEENDTWY